MKVVQLKAARAAALAEIEYCNSYHCAGDCGLPHDSKEFKEYAAHVLKTFDDFEHQDHRERKEKAAEVRRAARNNL